MTGRLHLVGGGWGGTREPGARSSRTPGRRRPRIPRIAVVSVRDGDEEEHAAKLIAAVRAAGRSSARVATAPDGGALEPAVLDDVDGVLVGGGLTPAYLDAVLPLAERIRALVAARAAVRRLLRGLRDRGRARAARRLAAPGVPVVDEEVAEELDELTVLDGLGLTDLHGRRARGAVGHAERG